MLNAVGLTFLFLISINFTLAVALELLNLSYSRKKARTLPSVFQDQIDQEIYARSIRYHFDSGKFDIFEALISFFLVIALVYCGGFGWIDGMARNVDPDGYYLPALVFAVSVGIIKLLTDLSLNAYSTFVIEERYGFNTTTLRLFITDVIKSLVLNALIGLPLYLGILWFMEKAGYYWWIWCWCFLEAAQIFLLFAYPIWIAPLFNKYTPLKNKELRDSIISLASRVGFPQQGIFVMDGSKRSRHSNAFLSGFGKRKRIVLFDTLLQEMNLSQILAVLAHELGHYRLSHVKKIFVLNSFLLLASLYLLCNLFDLESFYHGFGFQQPSHYAALILFSLSLSSLSFILTPFFSMLSRRLEYKADEFAVRNIESPKALSEVIVILAKENLMNLNPHPWYSFFHYTHPTPVERVKAIERLRLKKTQ